MDYKYHPSAACTRTHTCTHTRTHTCTHAHTQTHYAHAHARTHAHTHTCTHTHIHTHPHAHWRFRYDLYRLDPRTRAHIPICRIRRHWTMFQITEARWNSASYCWHHCVAMQPLRQPLWLQHSRRQRVAPQSNICHKGRAMHANSAKLEDSARKEFRITRVASCAGVQHRAVWADGTPPAHRVHGPMAVSIHALPAGPRPADCDGEWGLPLQPLHRGPGSPLPRLHRDLAPCAHIWLRRDQKGSPLAHLRRDSPSSASWGPRGAVSCGREVGLSPLSEEGQAHLDGTCSSAPCRQHATGN